MSTLDERLTQLVENQVMLSSSPLPGQHFQVLAEHAHRAMPHEFMALCLKDADQQGYFLHVLAGSTEGGIPFRLFGMTEGIAGKVLGTNQPVLRICGKRKSRAGMWSGCCWGWGWYQWWWFRCGRGVNRWGRCISLPNTLLVQKMCRLLGCWPPGDNKETEKAAILPDFPKNNSQNAKLRIQIAKKKCNEQYSTDSR